MAEKDTTRSSSDSSIEEREYLLDRIGIQCDRQKKRNTWMLWNLIGSYVIICALVVALVFQHYHSSSNALATGVYSPLDAVTKYERRTFFDNIWHKSPYQGPPTDTTDQLWEDLYNKAGLVLIDHEDAMRIPNATLLVGEEKKGLVQVEVMHQLHCLNALRKTLDPERYPDHSLHFPNGTLREDARIHVDHCIDRIRQELMCSVNTGLLFWKWRDDRQEYVVNMETTHVCRNYDAVRDWAFARTVADDEIPYKVKVD